MPSRPAPGAQLTVYLEGDGLAWETPAQPSHDPTPVSPTGLQLALADPGAGPVAYLARPCQFTAGRDPACTEAYWTGWRFAPEVVEAAGQALDALKARFGAARLRLVGFSGGGALAALLAARRGDVAQLVTVAGNLDHRAWTVRHRLEPLVGSLNPADYRADLANVPQWHFSGARDRVVPPAMAQDFAAGLGTGSQTQVIVVPGYDHHCCWTQDWPRLLSVIP